MVRGSNQSANSQLHLGAKGDCFKAGIVLRDLGMPKRKLGCLSFAK
jgi:hypothetical protein